MNTEVHEASTQSFTPLTPHDYPASIRLFLWVVALFSVTLTTHFILFEMAEHKTIGKQLKIADSFFKKKRYSEAIDYYNEIADHYPDTKDIAIKLAQSYFALSALDDNFEYMNTGMEMLQGKRYTDKEITKIITYVPQQHRDYFRSFFSRRT